ncbi:STAS domain-containing protein [Mycobacterium sp. ACS4331]|uniref:STAS domain-containing protein n=1 Tax=Mycobacterium sp. ACS4331 TaxID=1834121 RepID=UPI00080156C2|nr:STAS domain-containing protein [Mycobacterium sp. ACS4331]OBF21535.1 anti-anti-sigma factor [Mycobacterium sp. ACS4331]
MGQLDIQQDVLDGAVVVSAVGEVDSGNAGELSAHLDAARGAAAKSKRRLLVIALDHLKYFGSAGLNAVLDCHERGGVEGVTVRIAAGNAEVLRPIEVTKLDEVLDLYDTVHAATHDDGRP